MRAKSPKAVVTFASMSDVMAMEASAGELGITGRIIPVPSQIDAGCGMAWRAEPALRSPLEEILIGLDSEGIYELEF